MQDDCIAVRLGLPQLKILRQKEWGDHFEVAVIYHRVEAVCPRCGRITAKEHDRRQQRKQDRRLRDKRVFLILMKRRFRCPFCGKVFTEPDEVFSPRRRSSHRFREYLGDSRNDLGEFKMDEWAKIAHAAAQEDINFSLFSGDMVFCGFNPWEWEVFFFSASELLLKAPFITALGNHEYRSPIYFHRFALPGNEEWYSFNYGNVHAVVLNTETSLLTSIDPGLFPADVGPGSEQYEWLKTDLSQVPDNQWKVVMFHRPPYSCGPHGDQLDVQPIIYLFDEYNVDLVFCGHDHTYQRSKPIYRGRAGENGTIYVVSGGAGAPLYEVGDDPRMEYTESCYHYILVEIEKDKLCLQAKHSDGEVFDSFTLLKETIAESVGPEDRLNAFVSLEQCSWTRRDGSHSSFSYRLKLDGIE